MSDDRRGTRPGEAVAELVDSALRLSASVAQVVAEAATGKPQSSQPGEAPLEAIIRHGATTAGSVVSTVIGAARSPAGKSDTPAPTPPARPRVMPGNALRIPLSVENPGPATMEDITATRVPSEGPAARFEMTFEPERLTIAPNDFEKLVVTIAVPEDTPPGSYSTAFVLSGQEQSPIEIPVEVTAPKASPPDQGA